MTWQELGEGVFRRHYDSLNLNIGVVVSERGVLVVDTRASHREARELIEHLSELTTVPVRWVVNTHWHWDHTFGNALFAAELWGHERCRERLLTDGEKARAEARQWLPQQHEELQEVEITPPDRTFAKRHRIDLGDRLVELRFCGLGHTDNDIVVWVPDVSVLMAGDLVEEGAPISLGTGTGTRSRWRNW